MYLRSERVPCHGHKWCNYHGACHVRYLRKIYVNKNLWNPKISVTHRIQLTLQGDKNEYFSIVYSRSIYFLFCSMHFLCCSMYFLCCSMWCLFCDVSCIVCVYMCTEQLPPGGYPIAVKYIIPYHVILYIISYHIISYHIISYHISYHIISYIISSYHIIYHIISYIISYHIIQMIKWKKQRIAWTRG
jgi:hypothetical protein